MKVKWLNCRLTFQGETPEEDEALNAVWAAFGSQVDAPFDPSEPDDYELDSANSVDLATASESVNADH
jgi:hypothetical protein